MTAIVIDLGKVNRKSVKALKKGEGPLVAEVADAIASAESKLSAQSAGKMFVPVVVFYEKADELAFNPLLMPRLKR
jgi:hypothetical protein